MCRGFLLMWAVLPVAAVGVAAVAVGVEVAVVVVVVAAAVAARMVRAAGLSLFRVSQCRVVQASRVVAGGRVVVRVVVVVARAEGVLWV